MLRVSIIADNTVLSIVCGCSVLVDNVLCYQSCFDFWFRLITRCVISRASISDSGQYCFVSSLVLRCSTLLDNALCYQSCVDIRFSLITLCVISRASIFDSGWQRVVWSVVLRYQILVGWRRQASELVFNLCDRSWWAWLRPRGQQRRLHTGSI